MFRWRAIHSVACSPLVHKVRPLSSFDTAHPTRIIHRTVIDSAYVRKVVKLPCIQTNQTRYFWNIEKALSRKIQWILTLSSLLLRSICCLKCWQKTSSKKEVCLRWGSRRYSEFVLFKMRITQLINCIYFLVLSHCQSPSWKLVFRPLLVHFDESIKGIGCDRSVVCIYVGAQNVDVS